MTGELSVFKLINYLMTPHKKKQKTEKEQPYTIADEQRNVGVIW